MPKRSRKYFESFNEFQQLCDGMSIHTPPRQKQKLMNEEEEQQNDNNHNMEKERTPPNQIKPNPLSDDYVYSPSPPPPSILFKIENKSMIEPVEPMETDEKNLIFENDTFLIANIGPRNKRTNRNKKWNDLDRARVKVFKQLIPKNGGEVIEHITDFDTTQHDQTLIIIVSQKISRNDFDKLFNANIQNNEHFVFVTPEFISTSLTQQRRASFLQFQPKCLTQPDTEVSETKTNENEDSNKRNTIKQTVKAKGDWIDRKRHKFACQIENDGQRINYNQNITDIFDQMEKIYKCLGDTWREYAYKKANGFIKKHNAKLRDEDDVKQFIKGRHGISKKLGDKILEIMKTGKLRKLNELKSMPQIQTIELFTKIFGVGHKTAQTWFVYTISYHGLLSETL